MRVTSGRASRNSGDSLRLPGAETNGAITLQLPIAEGDDLIAFDLLVSAETDVVAAFLRRCRRSIAMDDGGVEEIGLMKLQHRAGKNGVKTAIGLPPSKCAINARVVNFWTAFLIFFDRQFLPLTPQIKRL